MAFLPLQASKYSNFKTSSISKRFSVTKIQIFSFREEKCSFVWSYDKSISTFWQKRTFNALDFTTYCDHLKIKIFKVKSHHWHEVQQRSLEKPFSILINWQISSSKYRSADYSLLLKNRSFVIHMYEALCYICTKTVFHLFFSMYSLNFCPYVFIILIFGAEF